MTDAGGGTPVGPLLRRDIRAARSTSSSLVRPAAMRTGDVVRRTPPPPRQRWSRRRGVTGVVAAIGAFGVASACVIGPTGVALAEYDTTQSTTAFAHAQDSAQSLVVEAAIETEPGLERGSYQVYVTPKPTPPPEPDPPRAAAAAPAYYSGGGSSSEWLAAAGIPQSEWGFVDYIVARESSWNPNATNASSGACGLVQALPCSKVPGNGYDPIDNLRWANGYATGRYGSWGGAYDFWINNHWW